MTVEPYDVSVVICAYTLDRWDDLVASVQSVQAQTRTAGEIIVLVDNNPELLATARLRLHAVRIVENTQTPGLGGARNSGIVAAGGKVIAFLDDDAVADPEWLENLCRQYRSPEVLGVGGAIKPRYVAGRPHWFPEEFAWVVGCDYRGMPETCAPVRNLTGCNMSFRREVLVGIGGFRLGYGCDETEVCIRIHQQWPAGILLYTPDAWVQHRVPATRMRWQYFQKRCYHEGGSKAVVTWMLGARDGLASERNYTLRTLPRGVARGLLDTVVKGDVSGLFRAGAIAAGLAITSAGYVAGRVRTEHVARRRGWTADGFAA